MLKNVNTVNGVSLEDWLNNIENYKNISSIYKLNRIIQDRKIFCEKSGRTLNGFALWNKLILNEHGGVELVEEGSLSKCSTKTYEGVIIEVFDGDETILVSRMESSDVVSRQEFENKYPLYTTTSWPDIANITVCPICGEHITLEDIKRGNILKNSYDEKYHKLCYSIRKNIDKK